MKKPTQTLPSIKSLLTDSLETTKRVAGRYLLWQIITVLSMIVGGLGIFVLLMMIIAGLLAIANHTPQPIQFIIGIIVAIVPLVAFFLFFSATLVFLIVGFHILADLPKKKPNGELMKVARGKIRPFLIYMLSCLLLFGSWFVFFIPGIIIAILVSFTNFAIIFKDYTGWSTVKRSIVLWQENTGELLKKYLLVSLGFVGISLLSYLLDAAVQQSSKNLGIGGISILFSLVMFVFRYLLSIFTIVYSIKIFFAVEEKTPKNKQPTMWWIWLTTAVGWIFFVAIVTAIIVFFKSQAGQDLIHKAQEQTAQQVATQLEEVTRLDQPKVDDLAKRTFEEINTRRVAQGNKPLALDKNLCAYGQKLLTQYEETGDYDKVNQSMMNDLGNQKLLEQYFKGYLAATQLVKFAPSSIDTPQSIAEYWNPANAPVGMDIVAEKKARAGCVVGNPDYLIMVHVK